MKIADSDKKTRFYCLKPQTWTLVFTHLASNRDANTYFLTCTDLWWCAAVVYSKGCALSYIHTVLVVNNAAGTKPQLLVMGPFSFAAVGQATVTWSRTQLSPILPITVEVNRIVQSGIRKLPHRLFFSWGDSDSERGVLHGGLPWVGGVLAGINLVASGWWATQWAIQVMSGQGRDEGLKHGTTSGTNAKRWARSWPRSLVVCCRNTLFGTLAGTPLTLVFLPVRLCRGSTTRSYLRQAYRHALYDSRRVRAWPLQVGSRAAPMVGALRSWAGACRDHTCATGRTRR